VCLYGEKENAMLKVIGSGTTASLAFLLWFAPHGNAAHLNNTAPLVARGVFCDTPEEVTALVTVSDGDIAARLRTVNDRFGKEACNMITAAYFKDAEACSIPLSQGIVHVVKVTMISFRGGTEWMHLAKPMKQYVPIFENMPTA
jgi:hypothetical protein